MASNLTLFISQVKVMARLRPGIARPRTCPQFGCSSSTEGDSIFTFYGYRIATGGANFRQKWLRFGGYIG
jgi:hypothetical protein